MGAHTVLSFGREMYRVLVGLQQREIKALWKSDVFSRHSMEGSGGCVGCRLY